VCIGLILGQRAIKRLCVLIMNTLMHLCVHQPEVGAEQLPDDERKKFEKEFDEYREKLDRAKEE